MRKNQDCQIISEAKPIARKLLSTVMVYNFRFFSKWSPPIHSHYFNSITASLRGRTARRFTPSVDGSLTRPIAYLEAILSR